MAAGAELKNDMSKSQNIRERRLEMRKRMFPHVGDGDLWIRQNSTGFITIPRALPLLMALMDRMSKGKPLSATYFELWCRVFDEGFVNLKPREMAYHAGFSGQRAEQTWSERIKILAKLKFIETQPGPEGDFSYAIIFNPYKVMKRHFEANLPELDTKAYNALLQRATEIGAKDLDDAAPLEDAEGKGQNPLATALLPPPRVIKLMKDTKKPLRRDHFSQRIPKKGKTAR